MKAKALSGPVCALLLALGAAWALAGRGGADAGPRASAPAPAPASVGDRAEAPAGMVRVPRGTARIGTRPEVLRELSREQEATGPRRMFGRTSMPSFRAEVDAFFLDEHPVTVGQFRAFVRATGYETQAERLGNAGVLDEEAGRWRLVEGATWRRPRGPERAKAKADHPVTQVSFNDATRYCQWKSRRLPTEVEWEHAARGATNQREVCAWDGPCNRSTRVEEANTWQGRFPTRNTVADGYRYTSPVSASGENELGLRDMSGNVWEWTASWFRPYRQRSEPFRPGPKSKRVLRGGSFLCNECGGYHVFSRSSATPRTSLFQTGFRCAKDAPAP